MNRIAHWLVYGALITAIAVLWNVNKAEASECSRETPCRIV
jgi:hypothetical protein